jgi:acetolactate synthase-1/2/3 large subunit
MTTDGYSRLTVPVPSQTLIHVHPGAEELNSVYQADLSILSDMPGIARALAAMDPVDGNRWADWTQSAHADYEAFRRPVDVPGTLSLAEVVRHMTETLPPDAILSTGAGNYAGFVARYYQYRGYRTLLGPTNGSMGYGVPSSVAAKLAFPERTVVSVNGDGCFLMNGQEMATAAQYGANVVFLVVNNGMYGTIRMHQERDYPGRESGTALKNPDFVTLAEGYGAQAERVTRTEEFAPAFERALNAGRPALIELVVDPEAITPAKTLSQIRNAALAAAE